MSHQFFGFFFMEWGFQIFGEFLPFLGDLIFRFRSVDDVLQD
jgi:hypothetical protein